MEYTLLTPPKWQQRRLQEELDEKVTAAWQSGYNAASVLPTEEDDD